MASTSTLIPACALLFAVALGNAASACAEPSNETLAQLFADLAAKREYEDGGNIIRWMRPINYTIVSPSSGLITERIPHVLERASDLAGLSLNRSETTPVSRITVFPEEPEGWSNTYRINLDVRLWPESGVPPHYRMTWGAGDTLQQTDANLVIVVDNRMALAGMLRGGGEVLEVARIELETNRAPCVVLTNISATYEVLGAAVLISNDVGEPLDTRCLYEELFQVFGFLNDVGSSELTLFDNVLPPTLLTPTPYDELFLRLLYHPDIEPGMNHAEAEDAAMKLIPSLRGYYIPMRSPTATGDHRDPQVVYPAAIPKIISHYHSWQDAKSKLRDRVHQGIDIGGPAGQPIIAIADGHVLEAHTVECWGPTISIDHGRDRFGDPLIAVYSHLGEIVVEKGQTVSRGEMVARLGANEDQFECMGGVRHLHLQLGRLEGLNKGPESGLRYFLQDARYGANPHELWADGPYRVSCFDGNRHYDAGTLTYPLPCGD